ncbi:MAG: HTH domain-containing protein [Candidatus Pacearchaeota archaeon]|nr:HTH domain-containing protein [Candidatus Pacearchaeota archaeon]
MARKKKEKKQKRERVKNSLITLEKDKNVFNVFIRPIIPFGIRQEVLEEPVLESEFKKDSINLQLNQIKNVKQLLSKEKIRIIYAIKQRKPNSVYELAKLLARDFKAVRQDLKVLESLGFVTITKTTIKNRVCSKPILQVDRINISIII